LYWSSNWFKDAGSSNRAKAWPRPISASTPGLGMLLLLKNKAFVVVILVIIVFLVGFVPQYMKVKPLENDLSVAMQENALE